MGRPRTMNTPRFVKAYRDRHGQLRLYLRHPQHPQVALPGPVWGSEFMAAYEAAMTAAAEAQAASTQFGASLAKPGALRAAARAYFADPLTFDGLAASTVKKRRRTLERFA